MKVDDVYADTSCINASGSFSLQLYHYQIKITSKNKGKQNYIMSDTNCKCLTGKMQ